jgi:ribosomal-protein-alanine N-acetyltransferase
VPEDQNRQLRLQTDRLTLIACTPEFVDALENGPDEAGQLLGADIPADWPDAELAEFLPIYATQLRDDHSTLGYGIWLVVADQARTLIGSAGFQGKPDEQDSIEIGFGVHPDFRNTGYATEAVNALLTWARQQRGVRTVIAHCDPSNPASIRVLEKAGMKRTRTRDHLLAWSTEPL